MPANRSLDAATTTRATSLVFVLVVPFLMAACVYNPCGANKAAAAEWYQPGVFEAFPSPGEYNGYSVSWRGPPDFVVNAKHAARTTSAGSSFLTVWEDNRTHWTISRTAPLSGAATGAALNQTFEDLGLPAPQPHSWVFVWGDEGC